MTRADNRGSQDLRPIEVLRGFTEAAPGSVLIRAGKTHVLCTACISDEVPEWRAASGAGWVTAEYEMLPGSTGQRKARSREKIDGRTHEIQRLIGRCLRAAVAMERLGPHTIYIDCDVLQADGGTRTAAITGAYIALCDALARGQRDGKWGGDVLKMAVAAISCGVVDGQLLLDLDYREDVRAEVDCNLAMTSDGQWIEVQATGERTSLSDQQLTGMLALGRQGIEQLFAIQRQALL
jgi:ribonuclease PH